jgi:hypothetical protein
MYFLCDIDGTIAERNVPVLLALLAERFNMTFDTDGMTTKDFLRHPDVAAYRQRVGEAWFRMAVGWCKLDPRMLSCLYPIAGALEGLQYFATIGKLRYCADRNVPGLPEYNQQIQQATYTWLGEQHFPCADQITFCDDVRQKLLVAAELIERSQEPVILIDDLYHYFIEAWPSLGTCLADKLTIYAYSAPADLEVCAPIPVVPFQWNDLITEELALHRRQGRQKRRSESRIKH